MKKETTRLPEEGILLEVQDLTSYNEALREGYLVQEEFDKDFSEKVRKGTLLNGKDAPIFLKKFGHKVPFFVGGSNTGTITGHSRFKSKRMLQLEILDKLVRTTPPSLQFIYDIGHYYETAIGTFCAAQLRKKGIDVIYVPCDYGYINTLWPSCLAHPDGFLLDRKSRRIVALAEVKTAHKESEAWKEEFGNGLVPEAYIDQVQFYMQILGIDDCYVLANNKQQLSEDDFVQIHVARDKKRAIKILDECERFVAETAAGIEYTEEVLPEEAPVIYRKVDENKGFIKLPRKTQGTLETLSRLAKDREALNDEIKESNRLIRQIEAEEKKLKSSLLPSIGNAPGGVLDTSKATYRVKVIRDFGFDADVKKLTAENFPEAWEAITSYKPTMKCKLEVTSKEEAAAAEEAG